MRTRFLPVWLLAVALIGAGWWQGNHDAARAATLYVTNSYDSGVGSLRDAISGSASGDTISVVTPGPILLNSGAITISHNLTIAGPNVVVNPTADPLTQLPAVTGQVAIQSDGGDSVFKVTSGNVVMSHLYITGGVAAGTTFPTANGDPAMGGGINNTGNLTLNYCTVEQNSAVAGNGAIMGGNAYGGGIYSTGTLTLNQSTVSNNFSYGGTGANSGGTGNGAYGGGIYSTGTTTINSSTISGNSAQGGQNGLNNAYAATLGGAADGGGLAQSTSGTMTLANVTITGNQAVGGNGGTAGDANGGGVAVLNATLVPLNCTIYNNSVAGNSTSGSGLVYSGAASLTINNSIVSGNIGAADDFDYTGTANSNGSFINDGDPVLGTLDNNGGPTLTMMPGSGSSPVVNIGDNTYSSSLSTDQRGAPRVSGGAVDAGAAEYGSLVAANNPPTVTPFSFSIVDGFASFTSGQFTGAVNYPDAGDTLQSVVITSLPSHGYLYLDGQKVLVGSVISVADLNNLTYQGTDSVPTDTFSWQASDGANVVSTIVVETTQVSYSPPSGTPSPAGNPADTVSAPYLYGDSLQGSIEQTGNTYQIHIHAVSTAKPTLTSTASQVTVTIGGSPNVTSGAPIVANVSIGAAIADGSISITPNSSGTKHIIVTATDILGHSVSYDFYFLADYFPVATNKVSNFENSDSSPRAFSINLGDTFSQEMTASDGDYSVPDYPSIKPEPLQFQVDQVCYGSGSTCSTSNTASNLGSFSDSNLSGNLSGGTTLDTTFNWKPTQVGIYGLKVTLSDYWGKTDTFVFTLTVNQPANLPPVITNPGTQTAVKGTAFNLAIAASDPESDPITYSITGLPSGVIMTPTGTGVTLSGIPTSAVPPSYTVTLSANDGHHSTPTTSTFIINVKDVGSPVITNIKNAGATLSFPLASPINVAAGQPFTTLTASAQIANYPDSLTFITYEGSDPTNIVGTWTNTNTNGTAGPPPLTSVTSAFSWPNVPAGTHVVTVRVTSSNTEYDEEQFTIQAGDAPTLTLNPSGTISATVGQLTSITATAQDVDANETFTFSLSGQPAGVALTGQTVFTNVPANTPESTQLQWTPTSGQVGSYTFNVIVTDGAGLIDSVPITINVEPAPPNSPPTVQNPGSQTVNVGTAASIQVTASDPDHDTLTYSATGLPAWASISPTTGLITGTPGVGDVGTSSVTVSVSDGINPAVSVTFQLTVAQTNNAPPVVSNPGTWIASVGVFSTTSVPATDTDTLTWSSSNLPAWVSLDPTTGILSGTPGSGDVGTRSVTVSVSDGVNAPVSVTFNIQVGAAGVPTLTATPSAPANPEELTLGQGYGKIFLATDSDYPDTLTFNAVVTQIVGSGGNTGDATFVPMYESGSASTGTTRAEAFEWTPDQSGTYKVVVSVTDLQSHVTSITFTIHVSAPPTITINPTTYSASPEMPLTIPVSVADPDPQDSMQLSLTNAPAGMAFGGPTNFVNTSSGSSTVVWTPTTDQASQSFTFNVTVTDAAGLSATTAVTVNVGAANARPVITDPGTIHVVQGHSVSIPITATDAENDPLSYSVSSSPSGLGLSINSSGVIVGTVTGSPGNYQETVNVDDGHHVSPASSLTFTIVVGTTNTAPTLDPISDQSIAVAHTFNLQPVASDVDNDALTFTADNLPAWATIDPNTGAITGTPREGDIGGPTAVTVNVTDGYSGTVSQTFNLTVTADNDPVIRPIADVSLHVGASLGVITVASDPDGDTLTYSASGLPLWANIDTATGAIVGTAQMPYGSYLVTVTASDSYGGSRSTQFTITVLPAFTATISSAGGYATITYTILNDTNGVITPVIRGSLTGGGYTDNANTFFSPTMGQVDDQWASPEIQRRLDPTKDVRILTWTVGALQIGQSATLTISMPVNGNAPHGTALTNTWYADYGSTELTTPPVFYP